MDEEEGSLTIHSFPEIDDTETKQLREFVKKLELRTRKAGQLFRLDNAEAPAANESDFRVEVRKTKTQPPPPSSPPSPPPPLPPPLSQPVIVTKPPSQNIFPLSPKENNENLPITVPSQKPQLNNGNSAALKDTAISEQNSRTNNRLTIGPKRNELIRCLLDKHLENIKDTEAQNRTSNFASNLTTIFQTENPQATSTPYIDTYVQAQRPQIQITQPQTPTSNVQMPNLSININVNTPKASDTNHLNGEGVNSDEMVPVNHTLIRTPARSQNNVQQRQQQQSVAAKSIHNSTAIKRIDFASPPGNIRTATNSCFVPFGQPIVPEKVGQNKNIETLNDNLSVSEETIVDQSPSASIAQFTSIIEKRKQKQTTIADFPKKIPRRRKTKAQSKLDHLEYRKIEETVKNKISNQNSQRTLFYKQIDGQESSSLITDDESVESQKQIEINNTFLREVSNRGKQFSDGFQNIAVVSNDESESHNEIESNPVSYQTSDEYETDENDSEMEMETVNESDSNDDRAQTSQTKSVVNNLTKHKTHQMSLSSIMINCNESNSKQRESTSASLSYLSEQDTIQLSNADHNKIIKKCFVELRKIDENILNNLNKSKKATKRQQIESVPINTGQNNKRKRNNALERNNLDDNQTEKQFLAALRRSTRQRIPPIEFWTNEREPMKPIYITYKYFYPQKKPIKLRSAQETSTVLKKSKTTTQELLNVATIPLNQFKFKKMEQIELYVLKGFTNMIGFINFPPMSTKFTKKAKYDMVFFTIDGSVDVFVNSKVERLSRFQRTTVQKGWKYCIYNKSKTQEAKVSFASK